MNLTRKVLAEMRQQAPVTNHCMCRIANANMSASKSRGFCDTSLRSSRMSNILLAARDGMSCQVFRPQPTQLPLITRTAALLLTCCLHTSNMCLLVANICAVGGAYGATVFTRS
eukprot:6217621-Amphidinium_carterae.1